MPNPRKKLKAENAKNIQATKDTEEVLYNNSSKRGRKKMDHVRKGFEDYDREQSEPESETEISEKNSYEETKLWDYFEDSGDKRPESESKPKISDKKRKYTQSLEKNVPQINISSESEHRISPREQRYKDRLRKKVPEINISEASTVPENTESKPGAITPMNTDSKPSPSLQQEVNSALSIFERTKKKRKKALDSQIASSIDEALTDSSDEENSTASADVLFEKLKDRLGNNIPPKAQKTLEKLKKRLSDTEDSFSVEDCSFPPFLPKEKEKAEKFFEKLPNEGILKNVKVILVSHLFTGRETFFKAITDRLEDQADLMIIPKTKARRAPRVMKHFKTMGYNIVPLTREDCKDAKKIADLLALEPNQKLIILDHGGYFADVYIDLLNTLGKDVVLGGSENTESGHYLYENGRDYPFPILSAARCEVKNSVAVAIADSVKCATEAILRKNGANLRDLKPVLFGYGKVGKKLASLLGANKPTVVETNILARFEARLELYSLEDRDEAIQSADIIFAITGHQSIKKEDYPNMKDGCYIATASSGDDELELPDPEIYTCESKRNHLTKYVHKETKQCIYLMNDGNAVNFTDFSPGVGRAILAVQGLELMALQEIAKQRGNSLGSNQQETNRETRSDTEKTKEMESVSPLLRNGLRDPSKKLQEVVAKTWMEEFPRDSVPLD